LGTVAERKGPREVIWRCGLAQWTAAAKDECASRLRSGHDERDPGNKSDLVADHDVLPLGCDPIGAVIITANEILEEVVAVETAPPPAKLGDPRPYFVGRGANSDRSSRREISVCNEILAG